MGSPGQPTLVVVDDDWGIRMLVRMNLEELGYRVLDAASAKELDDALASQEVALVLLDARLGNDNGVEVARRLRVEHPRVEIVFLTGRTFLVEQAAKELGLRVIEKPFSPEELEDAVGSELGRARARARAVSRRAS